MIYYYDMDGNPIPYEEFIALYEGDQSQQIVARTDLPGGVFVSTVLLGLDHSFGMGGPPLIFETMVFGPEDMTDFDCERYATREEAEAGHDALVTRWTGWTPGDPMPEAREASFLTQLIEVMEAREHMTSPDAMVVMFPKDIAERMEADNDPGPHD